MTYREIAAHIANMSEEDKDRVALVNSGFEPDSCTVQGIQGASTAFYYKIVDPQEVLRIEDLNERCDHGTEVWENWEVCIPRGYPMIFATNI